jgi:hypothetical protein
MIAFNRQFPNKLFQTSSVPDSVRHQYIPALHTGLGCFSLEKDMRE